MTSISLYPPLPSLGGAVGASHEEEGEETADNNSFGAAQLDEYESLLPRQSATAQPHLYMGNSTALEHASAETRRSTPWNPAHEHHQQQHQPRSSSSEAPDLITDLVMENSRLADEVANLRKMLSVQVRKYAI